MIQKILIWLFFLICLYGIVVFIKSKQACVEQKTLIFKDGNFVEEKIECEWGIRFLSSYYIGRMVSLLFNSHFMSFCYGLYQNSWLSKRAIDPFVKKYNILIQDFIIPEEGYKSFNDFFTRKLKPGARLVSQDKNVLIAPADSKLLVIPQVSKKTCFFVKSKPFILQKLLGDEHLAQEYEGGSLLLFRLAPYDYHRYHFPCDAVADNTKVISGGLESVHPIVYKSGLLPLLENERHITLLHTKMFGDVVMVAIGARFVGTIIEMHKVETLYKKGEELGYFSFGGSSLILLCKKDVLNFNSDLLHASLQHIETAVKMGEVVACLASEK